MCVVQEIVLFGLCEISQTRRIIENPIEVNDLLDTPIADRVTSPASPRRKKQAQNKYLVAVSV